MFFCCFSVFLKQRIFLTFYKFKWKGWTLWGTQGRLVESWTQTGRCFWPWRPLPKTTVGPCQPATSNVECPQRHIGVKRGTAGSRWGAWWRAEANNHLTPQSLCRMWTGWQSLSGDKDCCRKPLSFYRFTYGNLVTTYFRLGWSYCAEALFQSFQLQMNKMASEPVLLGRKEVRSIHNTRQNENFLAKITAVFEKTSV